MLGMETTIVCGIDEAGRGPLCGPVTAAAVVLPAGIDKGGLRDSKKLSPRARQEAAEWIRELAAWGLGWVSAEEIDRINILQASLLAMRLAFEDLERHPRFPGGTGLVLIVDGNKAPSIPGHNPRVLVKADDLVPEVSAASILAKTARDAWIASWVRENDPEDRYGMLQHKGYPTALHRSQISILGPSPIHRLSFRLPPRMNASPS